MKIVFVHPPIPYLADRKVAPPLGILYMAAYLREKIKGIELKVIDQNLSDEIDLGACLQEVINEPADVYALSFGTTQYTYAVEISKAIKRTYPKAVVICGGAHAAAVPEETLSDTGCDCICVTEGEVTVYELVKAVMEQQYDFSNIPGIYYKPNGVNGIFTAKRELIKDLDTLPFPARDLVPIKEYSRTISSNNAANIITARGCPGRCIFCAQSMWDNKLRIRSVENIIAEIDEIREQYGVRYILFVDDTLTTHRDRILHLCEELKKRDIVWRGWTRANYMDEELAKIMHDSGCESLCVGVESGSQKILDTLKKHTTVEQNYNAMMVIKNSGIAARASLVIGAPGETWDTINETLDFLVRVQPDDWLVNTFIPIPGCEAFVHPERFGMKLLGKKANDNMSFYDKFVILDTDKCKADRDIMEYENLSCGEIKKMQDYLNKKLTELCTGYLCRKDKKGFMFF